MRMNCANVFQFGHVIPKIGTAESLPAHPAGINNNAVDSLGSKEMMGTTERTPG